MSTLPLPKSVFSELEHYAHGNHHVDGTTTVAVITRDHAAGRKNRYTVVRVVYKTGVITVIGRELDIYTSRAVARRGPDRDGHELTDEEVSLGRSPRKLWRNHHGYFCCKGT